MPDALPASLRGPGVRRAHARRGHAHSVALAGRFNVYNLLAAVATGVALDLPRRAIEAGLASVASVPGRFQIVSSPGDDVTVVVDYAHTDDALKNLLEAVRPIAAARLTTVFGCGGDRDRSKRPLMGAVAARLSDTVGLTSDNPRSEDPERIIDEIELGIAPPQERGRPAGGAAASTGDGLRWWAWPTGARPSTGPSPRRGRATSWSSPAKGTRSTRSSAIACCRSTTSPRRRARWRGAACGGRRERGRCRAAHRGAGRLPRWRGR